MLRGIAHLPNLEFSGINMVEFVLVFRLDRIFQLVDRFTFQNLNPKDGVDVVSENQTVEQDLADHETLKKVSGFAVMI